MSTNLNPSAFRRLEAIGYIPGECNPIAWMLDRLERAAKVKPDDAATLIRRAHDMVRDLCKRRDEPGAREWQMSIPARPDHDPDIVIGAALDAADDLASEVGRLRGALATVTRERDEARADMADVQARYARAWEALCHIGEAIETAGYPQLLPERALRVGEGVAKIIGERDELRAHLRRVLDVERIDAHRAGATGCRCMMRSRAAERAYEMGQCPHQLADTALAGGKS